MNAPNQALTIELKRTALLLLSAFPRLFLCECVHLIVKKMLEVGRKKKKGKESKQTQLPGFELALLRQLLASSA